MFNWNTVQWRNVLCHFSSTLYVASHYYFRLYMSNDLNVQLRWLVQCERNQVWYIPYTYDMNHTHNSTCREPHPQFYVLWTTPTNLGVVNHTQIYTCREPHPQWYVLWTTPTFIRVMNHTHHYTCYEPHPQLYVSWTTPTIIRVHYYISPLPVNGTSWLFI